MARLFLAVPLTEAARGGLAKELERLLGRVSLPGRVVSAENWHITLAFLGVVDSKRADRLVGILSQATLGKAFRLKLGGLGGFPSAARATILWTGIQEGEEPLRKLSETVAGCVSLAGIPLEVREFRGHLTLSRLKQEENLTAFVEDGRALEVSLQVERIALYESRTLPTGSRYLELKNFTLPA